MPRKEISADGRAILNLDEAGEIGAAAACAVMIAAASTVATLLFWALSRLVGRFDAQGRGQSPCISADSCPRVQ